MKHHILTNGQTVQHLGSNYVGREVTVHHADTEKVKEFGNDPKFLAEIRKIAKENYHAEAYGIVAASVITRDYAGKKAELEAKRKKIEAAPILETGDTCEFIEAKGEKFTIQLIQRSVSDCVHFKRIG
jgi:hypothetical protein